MLEAPNLRYLGGLSDMGEDTRVLSDRKRGMIVDHPRQDSSGGGCLRSVPRLYLHLRKRLPELYQNFGRRKPCRTEQDEIIAE